MREILFRGKRTDRGEWVQGCHNETLRYNNLHWIWDGKKHFTVNPETIGQYTGLTDKNGTKIFEGDIVRIEDGVFLIKYGIYDLECCGCCFGSHETLGFCVVDKKDKAYSDDTVWTRVEVIGNIHDNPELLKGDVE